MSDPGTSSRSTGRVGGICLVATPIGNLSDLAPRAAAALAQAQVVACEDTRRTGKLLAHLGVRAPRLLVVNDHTEGRASEELIRCALAGDEVVVVSDAGLPGISDPGERLVAAAIAAGVAVEVIPGPSAGLTALVGSGLSAGRFVFEGFLPRKGSGRSARLLQVAAEERTVVIYEAPHRLSRTLADLERVCGGDRSVVLARELTKLHEEWWRGTLTEALQLVADVEPRGEYVVVLAGAPVRDEPTDEMLRAALEEHRARGASNRDAVAEVAAAFGVAKRRVYDLALG